LKLEAYVMPRFLSFLIWLPLSAGGLLAQSAPGAIQAIGSATISVNPDQAQLSVGVVTQGATAQDAGQQNAALTTTVLNALKGVLGAAGTIQTIGYSISPRYSTTQGQTSVIVGYTASNTVEVTTTDLSIIGRLIDTANQAGANNVGNLSFSLQNPEPVTEQALGLAAKQAQSHANAIAAGLGAKTGVVISAQEGASVTPVLVSGVLSRRRAHADPDRHSLGNRQRHHQRAVDTVAGMRIAVLSDIHDNVWKLAAALDPVGDADGGTTDVASTFMIYDTATGEVPGFEVSGSGSLPKNP
jgi:uncharacterized protein YggE